MLPAEDAVEQPGENQGPGRVRSHPVQREHQHVVVGPGQLEKAAHALVDRPVDVLQSAAELARFLRVAAAAASGVAP